MSEDLNKKIILGICHLIGFPPTALIFTADGVEPNYNIIPQDDKRWKELLKKIRESVCD
jgi:hypothetical protein